MKALAVLVVAVGVFALACSSSAEPRPETLTPGSDQINRLMTDTRTSLSVCVDSAGARASLPSDVDTVRLGLDSAMRSLESIPTELGERNVTAGCPPALEFTGERLDEFDHMDAAKYVTDETGLSPHRIMVYFVSKDEFTTAFKDYLYDWGFSEYLCESPRRTPDIATLRAQPLTHGRGKPCEPKTTSLYLPSDPPTDSLVQGILRVLGLQERVEEPTLDWQACVKGTPEPWCVHYDFCVTPTPASPEYCDEFWENQFR